MNVSMYKLGRNQPQGATKGASLLTLNTHHLEASLSTLSCDLYSLGLWSIFLANPVGEQSSASGMALYSDFCYIIHIEFVLGYPNMFLAVCNTLI